MDSAHPHRWLVATALVLTFCSRGIAADADAEAAKQYKDPARFESQVRAFEREDLRTPPPRGAIVTVGSSSMRMWNATVAEDLAPLTLIARGFGGSTMNDAAFYADRLVTPYHPRAVILYEGDNDLADGWGYLRLTPLPAGKTLVTWAVLFDVGEGVTRALFEAKMQRAALDVPRRLAHAAAF